MKKQKGFIKVIEAVIASVIILASLTYFFGYYIKPSEWPDAQIKLQSQDIMNALQINGLVDEYMKTGTAVELEKTIQNMVSERVGFSLDITGAPPPVVSIACACTNSQLTELRNRTDPFSRTAVSMRGRNIRFGIDKANIADINNEDANFDVLFIYGYSGFTTEEENAIKSYLENQGNVILFDSLTAEEIEADPFLQEVFGLSSATGGSSSSQFYKSDIAGTVGSKAYYYYYNITIADDSLTLDTGDVAVDEGTVAYSGSASAVHVHEYGKGRAVWFNYYSILHSTMDNGDSNDLLKSMILLASEDFEIVPHPTFTLTLPQTFFKTSFIVSDVDNVFDMYKITMTMWHIY